MNHRTAWCLAACAWFAVCHVGCGGASYSKYIPSATTAREALQTSLDKWKSGAGLNPIETPKVVITVFDGRWRERKRLVSYEILEEVKGADHPEFKVRTQVKGEPEEMTTYHVIGLDPLSVYRDEEYKQAQTW